MSLSVLVAMNDDLPRGRLWTWVEWWWHVHAPDAEIVVGHNADVPFNKARAYNEAARRASGSTFLVTDCDTYLPELAAMRAAFEAMPQPAWMRPAWVHRLSRASTRDVFEASPESPPTDVTLETPSYRNCGLFALIPADGYRAVDGFDERFAGWGNEDLAIRDCLDTLLAPVTVHDSPVLHLWHPRPKPRRWPGQTPRDVVRRNQLTRIYHDARRGPEAMQAVLDSPHRPRVFP